MKTAANQLASQYRDRKVLVTGGLGFIGSNLARRLADWGAEIVVADSLEPCTGGNLANLSGYDDRVSVRKLDLRNCMEEPNIFIGQDFVFNLAGRVSHIDSMTDPMGDLRSNLQGQVTLLEACRRYAPAARIVFASTRQIYGRPVRCPVDESHPLNPVDVNGINKLAAESYHSLYHRIYGLPIVSLRLTNTYGPRMRIKDARQTFLGIWIRRAIADEAFEIWGGDQKRDLTYVDDVLDAMCVAAVSAEAQGGVFNIGGGAPLTLSELARVLVGIARSGRFEVREFPPERSRIDIGDYFADDSAFCELTGWSRRIPLEEGLSRTLTYFRKHLNDYV